MVEDGKDHASTHPAFFQVAFMSQYPRRTTSIDKGLGG
jgi:hypothetical protein